MTWTDQLRNTRHKVFLSLSFSNPDILEELSCTIIPKDIEEGHWEQHADEEQIRIRIKTRSGINRLRSQVKFASSQDEALTILAQYFSKHGVSNQVNASVIMVYNKEELVQLIPGKWDSISVCPDMMSEEVFRAAKIPKKAKYKLNFLVALAVNGLQKYDAERTKQTLKTEIDQLKTQHSEWIRKVAAQELIFSEVQKKTGQEKEKHPELWKTRKTSSTSSLYFSAQSTNSDASSSSSLYFSTHSTITNNDASKSNQEKSLGRKNESIGGSSMELRSNTVKHESGAIPKLEHKNRRQSNASSKGSISVSMRSLISKSTYDVTKFGEIKYNRGPGYCLVISYDVNRRGNQYDETIIREWCKDFKLVVKRCKNMSRDNVFSKIEEVKTVFSAADCLYEFLLVFIMAHGGKCPDTGREFIAAKYEENQQEVEPIYIQQDIVEQFHSDSCQGLHDKPKIFIIQACRGLQANAHSKTDCVRVDQASTISSTQDADPTAAASPTTNQVSPPTSPMLPIVETNPGDFIPSVLDTLVWKSAVENCYATRIVEKGSWFIQNVIEVFKQDKNQSLRESINIVNDRAGMEEVDTKDENDKKEKTFPIPCVAHYTLRSDFYFFNPQERRLSQ